MKLARPLADMTGTRRWVLGILAVSAALAVVVAVALDHHDDAELVAKHSSKEASTGVGDAAFGWMSDPSLPRASDPLDDVASAPARLRKGN